MTTSGNPPGLAPQDFTQQRSEAVTEGVKALFWINGGGAVALLAFLQAIWKENRDLSRYVVVGIACYSLGVLLAGVVQLLRYSASFNLQEGKRDWWRRFRLLYLCAAYASLAAFFVGTGVVVWGAWCALR